MEANLCNYKYDDVKDRIIEIRNQQVILDSDVAELYGVETKHINQAVGRNLNKFPHGYIMIIADLLGNDLTVSQHETNMKIKLPFFEISRRITKVKK